ncbi:MAG: lasso peptide biosynthesis B2 protein [Myxococcales bacterium]|nr:lasso peptide biosynthesis B2 protein [Myxococcales bacterium]
MTAHLFLLSLAGTRWLGPERTAELLRRLGTARRRVGLAGRHNTKEAVRARVLQALRRVPLPIECLDQALVTWYLLNLKGHPATLKIGMRLSPVIGHAWVDADGTLFGEIPGLEDFAIVNELLPWGEEDEN